MHRYTSISFVEDRYVDTVCTSHHIDFVTAWLFVDKKTTYKVTNISTVCSHPAFTRNDPRGQNSLSRVTCYPLRDRETAQKSQAETETLSESNAVAESNNNIVTLVLNLIW